VRLSIVISFIHRAHRSLSGSMISFNYLNSMKSPRDFFHIISYGQYLFMIGAVYFYIPFIRSASSGVLDWTNINKVLIFFGIGISLSTLQDTRKTQNAFSRKIWESPSKGKATLIIMSILALLMIGLGLYSLFSLDSFVPQDISIGLIVLGIGFVGLLKAAIEMFENHRLDKNP